MSDSRVTYVASRFFLRSFLFVCSVAVVYPIIWTILSSLKTNTEFLGEIWSFPRGLAFDNYARAFETARIGKYFFNSLAVTFSGLLVMLVVCIPAAYVLSRFRFRFRKVMFHFILGGLFVSTSYTVVPIFLLVAKMRLLNNLIILGVVLAATSIPYNLFLLSGFFRGVPRDYEDASEIDGCGYLHRIFHVVVPLCRSGVMIVMLFGFMGYWNEWIVSFALLRDASSYTISIGIFYLMEIQQFSTDWGALFAGLVTVMFPTMVVYLFVQKDLTAGISLGGIKG